MAKRGKQPERGLRRGEGFTEERVTKDGQKRYQARWPEYLPGGVVRFRSKTFDTLDDAEDHVRTQAKHRRAGRYVPESELTVEQLLEEFVSRGSRRWTANTVATFQLSIRRYINPHLGKKKVVALTPRMVQLWIDDLVALGLSASIVVSAKSILSSALREAIQLGVRDTNPTLGVSTPKRRRARQQTWSLAEVQRVLAVVQDDPRLHAFYLTALLTGMRPGELRALMWSDIELNARTITCRRSMTRDASFRQMIGTDTKTQRSRVIAIPADLCRALDAWRHEQKVRRLAHPDWQDTGIVFDRGNGDFYPLTNLERHHSEVIARAGVTKIRLHDLRHTSATLELEAGTNPKIVAERLGHSSVMTTLDRYSHVAPDLQRSAADAMAARLLMPPDRARIGAREGSD